MMRIYEVIWKEQFLNRIEHKHQVTVDEVEQVIFSRPHVRRAETGRVKGEDLYAAYGRTQAGRYLLVFFLSKPSARALPISARDMTPSERRYYERQKAN